MRQRARVDANHNQVLEALRAAGWTVESTAALGNGFPDAVAYKPSHGIRFVEVKDRKGQLTEDQIAFHLRFPVTVIRSAEEALAFENPRHTPSYDERQTGRAGVTCPCRSCAR